jgi:hypothetical protein
MNSPATEQRPLQTVSTIPGIAQTIFRFADWCWAIPGISRFRPQLELHRLCPAGLTGRSGVAIIEQQLCKFSLGETL